MTKYKLAILASHPIQYQSPLFRKLAEHPKIDLMVYFCSDYGIKEKRSPGFSNIFKWDIPLLNDYKYIFLRNYSFKPTLSFLGLINSGIMRELFRINYDAILIHGWMTVTNWIAFLGAFLTKTPVFLRGENPLNQELLKPVWKIKLKKSILRKIFKKIKAFLFIGEENKKFYQFYSVPEKKLFFTPYAVDNKRFIQGFNELKDRKYDLKRRLGISPEKVVVLFCGKLINKKRPLDLLFAYEKIKSSNKALVYLGDGGLRGEIEDYIKKKNLKDIYLVGFKNQTELPLYYIIGDIFVLPSEIGETWGLVVNEAMCFQLPIIVSGLVGCSKDLVRHGENSYIYSLGDTDTLAFYLQDLINDEGKRRKFGERSFEIVQGYNYEKDIKGILKALEVIKNDKFLKSS